MTNSPRVVVAMLHVESLQRSVVFYQHLGFLVENTFIPDGANDMTWASLCSGDAYIMLTQASEPIDPEQRAVIFYLYYDDVHAAHVMLSSKGLNPGEMSYPFYCPRGEFRLRDPDGYCLMLAHT